MVQPGARLRALMKQGCVALPGAFNGLVGRLVAEAGFDGCYVSGGAVSAAVGCPDIGLLTLEGFTRVIHDVTTSSGLPCIADADTGFGEGEMVTKTVWEYHRAGAAGLHIEDQVFPKRCGHLDGKALIPTIDMAAKVGRARRASDACSDGTFIVCARTDARAVEGMQAAVARAKAYVEAGADMIFPEGLHTESEFAEFASHMKGLRGDAPDGGPFLLANMTEFGKTPMLPLSTYAMMGYHCVIFPVTTLRVAMKPVQEMLATLREKGTVEEWLPKMYSRQELYSSLRYTPGVEWTYPSKTKE
ncbi:unnamed protein product [Vitrella brassicaformis CCMP3155]|uniref:Methylisocitrate lyase n=1 Tax=Vitrella brassicaformis (strain CCMP3155) TaxID=1169540 RepID=A0A0G4EHX8_VITBC|nr:unnamed protein product [Vitrella brassicaformis CCMP3155]|eukprot:CEL95544.1 unnamed protein product [Vitrella brassicaformis CCMP3155]